MISRHERASLKDQPGTRVRRNAPELRMAESVGSLPALLNFSRKCRSASLISTKTIETSESSLRSRPTFSLLVASATLCGASFSSMLVFQLVRFARRLEHSGLADGDRTQEMIEPPLLHPARVAREQ